MKKAFWCLAAAVFVYEVVALANTAGGDTISERIWQFGGKHPLVPFALGLTGSHFGWQPRNVKATAAYFAGNVTGRLLWARRGKS